MLRCLRRRRPHHDEWLEQSQQAVAKTERLRAYIELQAEEAARLKQWAHERLEANHLTQLFESGRRR
jgi:hypothetical protein